jgi:predicted RNase H-like nuclease (RuvC/YqgF family)
MSTDGLGLKLPPEIQQLAIKGMEDVSRIDPIFMGLGFVLALVIVLLAIAVPIITLVKSIKDSRTDASKANAETALYEQLRAQIDKNSSDIEKLASERDEWYRKALHLEKEVERLKMFEASVNNIRTRLDEKDTIIARKDLMLEDLNKTIASLKDKIHSLEIRLTQDEQRFCDNCHKRPLTLT